MEKDTLDAFLQTHNRQEAADHFGVHLATVKRAIKRLGINYKKKSGGHPLYRDKPLSEDLILTENQQDIITGSLLGDGFLLATDIFRIKQKKARKEYVDALHQELSPFSTPVRIDKSRKPTRVNGKVSHKLEHWRGGYCWAASFSTRKHRIFQELRAKWYPEGKKIVPDDLVLTPEVITHWYLQDGSYSPKFDMVRLSCESFATNDITRLIDLLGDIGISSKMAKNQSYDVIDIYEDNLKLRNMIKVRPTCFGYKF